VSTDPLPVVILPTNFGRLLPPPVGEPPVAAPPADDFPPAAVDPPVTFVPPVAGEPPLAAVPPVTGAPPAAVVPPVTGAPPADVVPPVAGDPPVAGLVLVVAVVPPVAGDPPVVTTTEVVAPPVAGEPPVCTAPPKAWLPPVVEGFAVVMFGALPPPPKDGKPPTLERPPAPKVPPPLSDPLQPTMLRPAVRTKIWTVVVRTNTSYRWRRNRISPSKRVPQAVPIGTRLRQKNRWLLWVANNANGGHRNLWRSSIFDLLFVPRGNGKPWPSVAFRYYDGSTQSPDCASHLEKYVETGLTHLAGDASTGRRC